VRLAEPKRQTLRFFTDNAGSQATGEVRAGAIYQNASVLGFRDQLTLTGTYAEGYRGWGVNYAVPWNTWGGRVQVGYFDDRTDVIDGSFRNLDLNGTSRAVIGAIRQPVITTLAAQLDAVVGAKTRTTDNYAGSVLLQETETRDVSVGVEASRVDARGLWFGNLYGTSGHYDITGGFTGSYSIYRGALRRVHAFTPTLSARGGITFQYSGADFLPSSEQFFIGGEGAVRGYGNGLYGGNKGYVLTGELHRPVWGENPEIGGTGINGFLFTDYGQTYPPRPAESSLGSIDLWSAGAGVLVGYRKWLSGRLTAAYRLRDAPGEDQGWRVLFTLIAEVL
jgi:hemolysin activation/secretion protein